MAEIKALLDEYGVIHEAIKTLPDDKLKLAFLEALAELEDNEAHRTRTFPKTRLHRVTGVKQAIIVPILTKSPVGDFMCSISIARFS